MQPDSRGAESGVAAFRTFRAEAEPSAFSEAAPQPALDDALFSVWLWQHTALVGKARLVGDGGTLFQVADIAAHTRLQRRGWGGRIMNRVVDWPDRALPPGCDITLITDTGAERCHEQNGLSPRDRIVRAEP